jgi:hypothetical protein
MDDKGESTLQAAFARTSHPETRFTWRLGFQLLVYGATAGLVTTALGAFVSSGLSGPTKIFLWILVTGILAVGAIGLSDPVVVVLVRRLCLGWLRRTPSSR